MANSKIKTVCGYFACNKTGWLAVGLTKREYLNVTENFNTIFVDPIKTRT